MDLARRFEALGVGTPPPADGLVEVVGAPAGVAGALFAFSDHAIVAADVDPGSVHDRLGTAGVAGVLRAEFVLGLADEIGAIAHGLDVLFMAQGSGSGADGLRPVADASHPRVRRARRFRSAVEVYEHPAGGILVLGVGIAGRREIAFEVDPESRNRGLGRNLVAAALALTPHGEPVFAQVAPGNVASMRAALAGGFSPVGAEILLESRRD